MASGRRHWKLRLGRLVGAYIAGAGLSRAERRQLRKLLGREAGAEWRSLGNIRGGAVLDDHTRWVLEQAKQKGHIAKGLQ